MNPKTHRLGAGSRRAKDILATTLREVKRRVRVRNEINQAGLGRAGYRDHEWRESVYIRRGSARSSDNLSYREAKKLRLDWISVFYPNGSLAILRVLDGQPDPWGAACLKLVGASFELDQHSLHHRDDTCLSARATQIMKPESLIRSFHGANVED